MTRVADEPGIAKILRRTGLAGSRLIGQRRALAWMILGDPMNAADAAAIGLINRVVPAAQLDAEVDALASRIATGPAFAYASVKRLVHQAPLNSFDEQLEAEREGFIAAAGTADFREGVAAFFERRAPAALHGFLASFTRYAVHLTAYLCLAADPYPAFTGNKPYPVDVEIDPPAAQGRWGAGFRLVSLRRRIERKAQGRPLHRNGSRHVTLSHGQIAPRPFCMERRDDTCGARKFATALHGVERGFGAFGRGALVRMVDHDHGAVFFPGETQ